MSYRLFLDDERFPRQVTWVLLPTNFDPDWVIVRTYDQFVEHITKNGLPEFIAFDHDLGLLPDGTEDRSTDVLKWLDTAGYVEAFPPPKYAVHSDNPEGAKSIHAFMQSWAKFWRVYKR